MKFGIISVFATAACLYSQAALANVSDAEQIIGPTIKNLEENNAQAAVDAFFAGSEMMAGKQQELSYLVTQIRGTLDIYGKISDCELVDSQSKGQLLLRNIYICQHEKFLTRWTLSVARTGKGWTGLNLSFDDKVEQLFD